MEAAQQFEEEAAQQDMGMEGPTHVSELQALGIAAADIEKLRGAGYHTISAVYMASKRELLMVKGLSEAKVEKLVAAVGKSGHVAVGFTTAASVQEQRESLVEITTGCKELDNILEGGIETGSITEIYGEYRCGKTQLCHTLCVTCQLPTEHGGGEGKALYIDTEGTFRPQRIMQIAQRFGLESKEVLDNIAYARAHNTEMQERLLVTAASLMSESRFALIVVDSATALFRNEFVGRGQLAERQNNLGRFLKALQRLADEYGVAVVVTNQVVCDKLDGSAGMFSGPAVKAIGGNIMAHATTTRIFVKKGRGESRIAKIMASPSLPEREATFGIANEGIVDHTE